MLQAYVDDSASDQGDQRLFLAGYINTADRWIRFSEAWAEELRQPPAIGYLKMSEANGFGGEFSGWNAKDRDEKLSGLARIIRYFQPKSIHCSVSQKEYRTIVTPVAPHGFGSPYFICFQGIMIPLAHSQVKAGSNVPVDFIFDDQEGLGRQAAFLYEKIRDRQSKDVRRVMSKTPNFGDDKDVLPLQAADMLAWHIRKRHEITPDAFQVPELLSYDGLHMGIDIDVEQLTRIAKGFKEIPGAARLQRKSQWKRTYREIEQLEARGIDTSKIKRPGVYYPKSVPIVHRMIGAARRWLSNPRWPPRDKMP